MNDPRYKPSEEDVLAMLEYLRRTLPKYASPEKAILLLSHYQGYYQALETMHPEEVEKILQDLEHY